MNVGKRETLARVLNERVVVVARGFPPRVLLGIGEALVQGGLACLEVTLDGPDAVEAIDQLARTFGDRLILGAGTVLDEDKGRAAIQAGARFLVSPGCIPGSQRIATEGTAVLIPGALTPREILLAVQEGADLVKVFPTSLGGPRYISEVRGPLKNIPLMVTGGVTPENIPEYFRCGVAVVGIGRAVLDEDAISRGDFGSIAQRAATLRKQLANRP